MISYDNILRITRLEVDPDFDFNKHFNYKINKWNSLVSNYVDLNYLDLVKAEVRKREVAKDTSYNISYIFSNAHGHGKGCLLSLTFTRRPYFPDPLLIIQLRSSEIVKRLIFDLLLAQRIGEYVYGENTLMGGIFYLPNTYTMAEVSAVYDVYKPLKDILYPDLTELKPFQKKVMDALKKMTETNYIDIKYKIHLRSAKVLQGGTTGAPLLVKNLRLSDKLF